MQLVAFTVIASHRYIKMYHVTGLVAVNMRNQQVRLQSPDYVQMNLHCCKLLTLSLIILSPHQRQLVQILMKLHAIYLILKP